MLQKDNRNPWEILFVCIGVMFILIGLGIVASAFRPVTSTYVEDDVVLVDGSNPMTGDLILSGGARVYRGSWIPATGMRAPPTKPATFVDYGVSGAWEFTDGAEEQIVANIKIPYDADMTEDFTILVGWSSPAQSLNCAWDVSYLLTGLNEDTTASAQEVIQSFETSSATANGLIISSFEIDNASQISATDFCVHISVLRDGNEVGHFMCCGSYSWNMFAIYQ